MDSKQAMKVACEDLGIKEVAKLLQISPTSLYNQINDSSRKDILTKFIEFNDACGNDHPLKWICAESGGFFVKNPDVEGLPIISNNECIPRSLKEFSDVIKEIGDALQDGKITNEEIESIRKEWDELKILLESFILSYEQLKI